jgi:hypothetical protein
VVTRTLGGVTTSTTSQAATLAVNNPPSITTQPVPATVVAGANAGFSVAVAGGAGTLSYQWRRNGVNLAGATNASFSVTSAGIADTGAFSVVVTRTLDGTTTSTTSADAALLVNAAPTITAQPADSVYLEIGASFSFSVTVATTGGSSAGTLSYQWRKDGAALTDGGRVSGATTSTLTVDPGEEGDVGDYSVVVTRTLNGTTTSTTSEIGRLIPPVSIAPGAFVIRVDNRADPFTFQLPAGSASVTDRLTLSISDVYGRTIWSSTVHPSKDKVSELTWNGRTRTGHPASAGMYVVRISVRNDGNTTHYVRRTVTLKPR